MKIVISGASGFIGRNLCEYLSNSGNQIVRLTRNNSSKKSSEHETHIWDPGNSQIPYEPFLGSDVVIHLGGCRIFSFRWTKKHKEKIISSRVETTRLIAKHLSQMKNPPKKLIIASATGFYGNTKNILVDETAKYGDGFLANTARKWEDTTSEFNLKNISVTNTRFGMVIDHSGGTLPLISVPFKYGFGALLTKGDKWISWVSLIDVIKIFDFILKNDLSGPVNIVNEKPIYIHEFCEILSNYYNKKIIFKIPNFFIRSILGEMGKEMILTNSKVAPKKLVEAGYKFEFNYLDQYLKSSV